MNAPAFDFSPALDRDSGEEHGVIRSVTRALKLLTLINTRYAVSLHDLHRMSGLPKPTVFRILSTLQAEGYVEVDGRAGVYRVGEKVCELSAGYSRDAMLVDLCRPILLATTQRIKWPLALGVVDGLEMVVRFSTMPYSPMAVQHSTQGQSYSLLRSAMGAAHLAFCPKAERDLLLELALEEAGPEADVMRIERRIEAAQRRGYGLRLAEKSGDCATAALPIRDGDHVLGVLSLTTFGSLMGEGFVDGLRETLDQVVEAIQEAWRLRVGEPQDKVAVLRRPAAGASFQSAKSLRA